MPAGVAHKFCRPDKAAFGGFLSSGSVTANTTLTDQNVSKREKANASQHFTPCITCMTSDAYSEVHDVLDLERPRILSPGKQFFFT